MAGGRLPGLLFILHAAARLAAEQEVENLSGLSPNPEKDIFVVRENRTTCLMAEFAAKFIVPYDVWASNYVDLITEQADIPLSRGAEMKGKCGTNESELELSWLDQAYTLKLSFLKEGHNTSRGPEASWRLSRIQFTYDTSERTYFKDAVSRKRPKSGFKADPGGRASVMLGWEGSTPGLLAKFSLGEKGNHKHTRQSPDQLPALNRVLFFFLLHCFFPWF